VWAAALTTTSGRTLRTVWANSGRLRVKHACELWFTLGLVHRSVGGGVDDHVWPHAAHRLGQTGKVAKVAAQSTRVARCIKVQGHQFTQHRQAALQLPPDLATPPQKQYLHAVTAAP